MQKAPEKKVCSRDMTDRSANATTGKPGQLPPYKVLLHNDPQNKMDYVADTICMITTLGPHVSHAKMLEAHREDTALLLTTNKERAELYREQFQSKGLTVTIESA